MAKRLRTKDEPNTNVIFNKDREPIVDSEKVEEIWTEYFDELLNVVDNEEYMEEDNPQMEDQEQDDLEPIHGEEVRQAIRALLYTSDAADERSSVDLGGRRII